MPDPNPYTPSYDFSDFEADNPTSPKPGAELDIEFANIATANGAAVDAIKDIRRSDGALKNGIVTLDALASDVQALLGESDYLQIVSDNISQIVAVSDDLSDTGFIETVATDLNGANTIGTVAGNLTGADTIGAVAADLTGANTIGAVAGEIANVVTVGENIEDVNRYANTYLPPSSTPPTTRVDGSPLQAGDLWYDTSINEIKKYDGAAFTLVTTSSLGGLATGAGTFGSAPDGEIAVGTFTTLFVWVNGVLLREGDDYTQDGSSFTILAPQENDEWAYWAYQANDATDYYTKIETNGLLDDKADATDVYTKTEADTLLVAKTDTSTTATLLFDQRVLGLLQSEYEGEPIFLGGDGSALHDGFGTLDYVDVAGATNLDISTASILKPTSTSDSDQTGSADATFAYNTTTFNKDVALDNSKTVVQIGLYSQQATTVYVKIALRNSSTSVDVVLSEEHSHPGGGWADFQLNSPYAVPASGSYYLGAYCNVAGMDIIDNTVRITGFGPGTNVDVGTGIACTESTGTTLALRAIYSIDFDDLDVASIPVESTGVPSTISLVVLLTGDDVINSDAVFSVSRDEGGNWSTATMAEMYRQPGNVRAMKSNAVDVSGQPSSSHVQWRLQTSNNADIELRAVAVWGA